MRVTHHWAERFINFFVHNTKLMIRGERGKSQAESSRLYSELGDALAPFFDGLRAEAIREGHQYGVTLKAERFDWSEQVALHFGEVVGRRYGVRMYVMDIAGNPIGLFTTPVNQKLRQEDADEMVERIMKPGQRMTKEIGS